MLVIGDARRLASEWVAVETAGRAGFAGAFFHGSVNSLPDHAALSPASDVDVMVVFDGNDLPHGLGKFVYRDVVLEVSFLRSTELPSPEVVLGQYHLAGSFAAPSIIADPSGRLTALQMAVARDFATRRWVRQRCEHASAKVLHGYSLVESDPFHDQVFAWLFPTGILTHVLLVAGLKNPTVRRRYVAVRELLAEYGHLGHYDTLLDLLGCARMSRECVERHLDALAEAFDAAKTVVRTPFPFARDISDIGRPIAIDGSRELIARGDHREAIFWMVATWSRCQQIFHHDGPAGMEDQYDGGYRRLLDDLGIASFADLQRREARVKQNLPKVREVAETIISINPDITD